MMKVLMDTMSFNGQVNRINCRKTRRCRVIHPITTAYAGEIVCDAVFLNSVPNAKYWYTPMITGCGDVTVILKQVLLPNTTMMKIDKINILPKRCNKKEATNLGAIRMSNDNIDDIIEEIHRRDKLDTYFDIQYDGEDINGD